MSDVMIWDVVAHKEISDFIRKWQRTYPKFNPPTDAGKDGINDYII
jgi:hypothetical protein